MKGEALFFVGSAVLSNVNLTGGGVILVFLRKIRRLFIKKLREEIR